MKQGDKFIVIDKRHRFYGKQVEFLKQGKKSYMFTTKLGNTAYLLTWQIKPLERFPADDEQPNN